MKYQTLLFDLDDTLLDFQAAEKAALKKVFADEKIPWTTNNQRCYQQINQKLWQDYEQGKKTRKEVTASRFGKFLATFDRQVDSEKMDDTFRSYLAEGSQLLGNSQEILADLAKKADLYVVTNGVSQTQRSRLKKANLTSYFKDVFISEETGYQKPMKEFFDYVFRQIPQINLKKTVIIGDSLTSDMKGGQNAGIDTIWFNQKRQVLGDSLPPTYEISQLEELYKIL